MRLFILKVLEDYSKAQAAFRREMEVVNRVSPRYYLNR